MIVVWPFRLFGSGRLQVEYPCLEVGHILWVQRHTRPRYNPGQTVCYPWQSPAVSRTAAPRTPLYPVDSEYHQMMCVGKYFRTLDDVIAHNTDTGIIPYHTLAQNEIEVCLIALIIPNNIATSSTAVFPDVFPEHCPPIVEAWWNVSEAHVMI